MENLYKRDIIDEILKFLNKKEIIVIYGARQVGKTSIMQYLIKNHLNENTFYFDLEMGNLLKLCNAGAEAVYNYLIQKGADFHKKIYLLIDEIQYLENPSNFLKIMHDHFDNVKLIVSGSSTFEIKKKFKQSLAGRMVSFELYPLKFREFLIFKEKHYTLSNENSEEINKELIILTEEYIRFGGYPKIVLEPSVEIKQAYLFQLINTYIRKDIRDIGNIRDISGFNKLIEILASQNGRLLNINEISKITTLNKETIVSYISILEKTFVVKLIRPFHKNLRSELTKNPKLYFLDTGLMHLLAFKEFPQVVSGESFESFVFLELTKEGLPVNFWRTTNKQEVDFIVSKGNKLIAVECKLNFQNADKSSLRFFSAKYNCSGFIIALYGRKEGFYIWEFLNQFALQLSL